MPPSSEHKNAEGGVVKAVLTEDEIIAVASFTLEKSSSDWKK